MTDEQMTPMLAGDGSIDERETAFQTWALLADRSPKRTHEILLEAFEIDINPKTIATWSHRQNWAMKTAQLYADSAPTLYERTRAALMAAGPPAAMYILDAASGRVKPDKTQALLAFGALDRLGFLPHTRREAEQGKTPANHVTGDTYEALSDEELRQAIASRVRALARD